MVSTLAFLPTCKMSIRLTDSTSYISDQGILQNDCLRAFPALTPERYLYRTMNNKIKSCLTKFSAKINNKISENT